LSPLTVTFNIQLSKRLATLLLLAVAVPWSVEDQKVHKKVEAAQKVSGLLLVSPSLTRKGVGM